MYNINERIIMKKYNIILSIFAVASGLSCQALAQDLPADIVEKQSKIVLATEEVVLPADVSNALKNLENAINQMVAEQNTALADLETSAKNEVKTVEGWEKVKGCDNVISAVVQDATAKDSYISSDTKVIASEIAKMKPAYEALSKAINDAWSQISTKTANAQYNLGQAKIDTEYLTAHDKDPNAVSNDPPCRCAKPKGSLQEYTGGEVQFQNNQWRYWIDKNSEKTIAINEECGLIPDGTLWNKSRTPTNKNVTAWVENNTVICVEEK